ncbi:hypothetical protein GXB81_14025 [Paraburkholderia sp. Ac-20336]|uniref:hypothetical protein n=1 Tax=Paraburkholderia sp. Ac-20336 TaxID=2703886 RepID=UPI00198234A2|nr:hypothetical protein [Paraburkholderia sp. Ac-20336]MBN3804158.1 hypothetical protein [Paraburkholderia sp. Ac-20336]
MSKTPTGKDSGTSDKSLPTVVVRRGRSRGMPAITPQMKERLRAAAKISKRKTFPELPDWRIKP